MSTTTAMDVCGPADGTNPATFLRGLRGLTNLGNTCFMNSVLQVFLHCPPVIRFFLSDCHNRFECISRSMDADAAAGILPPAEGGPPVARRACLACEMDMLFTQCFSGKQAPFSPHSFLHAMWSTAESFAGYEQQDAHEFLIQALAAIDAGLAGPRRSLAAAASPQYGDTASGMAWTARSVEHHAAGQGGHDLQRIFTGVIRSDVTCLTCQRKSTKFEDFHDVSLDLTKNDAGGGGAGDGGGGGYHDSLAACLRAFTRPERMSSAERCWCSACGQLQESAKQLSFHRLPCVLCFHLKRFEHGKQVGGRCCYCCRHRRCCCCHRQRRRCCCLNRAHRPHRTPASSRRRLVTTPASSRRRLVTTPHRPSLPPSSHLSCNPQSKAHSRLVARRPILAAAAPAWWFWCADLVQDRALRRVPAALAQHAPPHGRFRCG